MKKIILVFLSLTIIILTGCDNRQYTKNNIEVLPVEAVKIVNKTVNSEVIATGNIYSSHIIKVSTKLMSRIEKLPFSKGDKVKKADLLLSIDANDVKAKIRQANAAISEGEANLIKIKEVLSQAQANFDNISKNYQRMSSLFKKGSIDKKRYDDTETAYKIAASKLDQTKAEETIVRANIEKAKAMKDEANANLKYSEFYSPFEGYVVEKYSDEGNMTSPGMPIMEIQDLDKVFIDLSVSEMDISKVEIGDTVEIFVDALQKNIYGNVNSIIPGGNLRNRTFLVRVVMENKDRKLLHGMFVKAKIITDSQNGLTIPFNSVLESNNDKYIFLIRDDVVKRIKIESVIENSYEILIKNKEVKKGDLVVVNGIQNISEGMKVRVVSNEKVKEYGTL